MTVVAGPALIFPMSVSSTSVRTWTGLRSAILMKPSAAHVAGRRGNHLAPLHTLLDDDARDQRNDVGVLHRDRAFSNAT